MIANNDCLRLPFLLKKDLLEKDLTICVQRQWVAHYKKTDFEGDWNSIALYAREGKEENIMAVPTATAKATPLLEDCPYFTEIIDRFECTKEVVRLMRLGPGSQIKEHTDKGCCYEQGCFRIHIPIQTNEQVDFVVLGQPVPMKVGECWYANFDKPHSVANQGLTARVHLVLDCLRNDWSDTLFAQAGYDFEEDKKRRGPEFDQADIPHIIKALEGMDNEGAKREIQRLKKLLDE